MMNDENALKLEILHGVKQNGVVEKGKYRAERVLLNTGGKPLAVESDVYIADCA